MICPHDELTFIQDPDKTVEIRIGSREPSGGTSRFYPVLGSRNGLPGVDAELKTKRSKNLRYSRRTRKSMQEKSKRCMT